MKKSTILVLFIAIFLSVSGAYYISTKRDSPDNTLLTPSKIKNKKPTITVSGITIKVEVADTDSERAAGLSNRKSLKSDEGMLFLFDNDTQASFWMKDMNFGLDIIWIDDGEIVHISNNVPPPEPGSSIKQLKLYSPPVPYDTVLEVNAGFSKKNNFEVGDSVDLSSITN